MHQELRWDSHIDAADIGVAVEAGIVSLSGTVNSFAERQAAQEAALRDGEVLPFLGGRGLMAVSMQVPIVPFQSRGIVAHVSGLGEIRFPRFRMRRGAFRLVIGEPLTFPKTTSYQKAAHVARQALIDTR